MTALLRALQGALRQGAPVALEGESAWRRYFAGRGFPMEGEPDPGSTFAAHSAAHVLLSVNAARRAHRHVPGQDGAALLRSLGPGRGAREGWRRVLGGHHLREAGLGDVLESALFEWVAEVETPDLDHALTAVVTAALERAPAAATPAAVYLLLSPAGFRRALGEHYTPGWLADLVLERVGFEPHRDSVLDPTCGAGVFLSKAVGRIRIASRLQGLELARDLRRRVRGLELNPVAVSLSRLAYLDALGSATCGHFGDQGWTVPVVLGDALFGPWPDGEPVSLLTGNPPWLSWERLSVDYREAIRAHPAGLSEALFPHRGLRARSGGAHDDLAGLIAYGAADRLLAPDGRLGLVLPVSLFRSRRGGEGFRRLRLADRLQLDVRSVDDLTALKPFPGAAGRTAVLVARRGGATRYPVAWNRWGGGPGAPRVDTSLAAVCRRWEPEPLLAEPVTPAEPTSPWLVGSAGELERLRRLAGESPYRARKGVDTSLNAVFWVESLGVEQGLVRVRNAQTRAKVPVKPVEVLVEPDALYPLLRGRDFNRWTAAPRFHQVLLYDPATGRPLPEDVVGERFPRARAYLARYEVLLTRRGIYRKHLQTQPVYACYDIGPYSFAPVKVVWKALAAGVRACVVERQAGAPTVPDHNVVLVPLDDPAEAHFLCGVLNSRLVTRFADAYTGWFYSTHLLQTFKAPQYNRRSPLHREITALSLEAHGSCQDPDDIQARLDPLVERLYERP